MRSGSSAQTVGSSRSPPAVRQPVRSGSSAQTVNKSRSPPADPHPGSSGSHGAAGNTSGLELSKLPAAAQTAAPVPYEIETFVLAWPPAEVDALNALPLAPVHVQPNGESDDASVLELAGDHKVASIKAGLELPSSEGVLPPLNAAIHEFWAKALRGSEDCAQLVEAGALSAAIAQLRSMLQPLGALVPLSALQALMSGMLMLVRHAAKQVGGCRIAALSDVAFD